METGNPTAPDSDASVSIPGAHLLGCYFPDDLFIARLVSLRPPLIRHLGFPYAFRIKIFFETSRTGYTVHKPRFFKSLNLPPKYRPHPCLLNVIFLIACHHSQDPLLTVHQEVFLARSRKHLQASLKNRDRLLHFLSGSTLLGYYFLKSGRFLEASYQVCVKPRASDPRSNRHGISIRSLVRHDSPSLATFTKYPVQSGSRHPQSKKEMHFLPHPHRPISVEGSS